MRWPVVFFQTIILIVWLLLSGCGGEPYTYESDRELKPGPGLFSGKDGEFTIIGASEKKREEQEEQNAKSQ